MLEIITMQKAHWEQVKLIYEEGIATGIATFETQCPDWENWNNTHLGHSRLVAKVNDKVKGWAALSAVSDRCVYGGVAELSIYIAEKARGQGIGSALLNALIEESEKNGIWTLNAGIFPETLAAKNYLKDPDSKKLDTEKR